MNNFTEQDRIEQFKEIMKPCMPNRFTKEFINILKENSFFTAPASIHHHGAYSGGVVRSFPYCYQFIVISHKAT